MKIAVLAWILVGASFPLACGGRFTDIADESDAGEDGGGTTDGGAGGGDGGGGGEGGVHDGAGTDGSSTSCPATPPAESSPCGKGGLVCEYGNDFSPACDTLATCQEGRWHLVPPQAGGCPTPDPGVGPGCPSTYAGVTQGGICAPMGLQCSYPDGRCACTILGGPVMLDAGAGTWHCAGGGRECPYPRPRIGTPCAPSGTVCDYGGCFLQGGTTITCQNGSWEETPTACPASAGGH
jgi:hypothetical protein